MLLLFNLNKRTDTKTVPATVQLHYRLQWTVTLKYRLCK